MDKITDIRRKNRAISDEAWIKNLLENAAYGVIAMEGGGQPYINSNLFLFDESQHCIYFHTAGYGFTKQMIGANPKVCFSIFEMGRLLPGKKAVDFSCEYKSVVIFGNATIIDDIELSTDIFKRYFDKYASHLSLGKEINPFTQGDVEKATVYKIEILDWSAKENKQPEEYEGAFHYNPPANNI